ncbi:MAG: DegT/DnrJ/EryC1/StrS family aminotransferase [Prosthecobacter sp.]|uniref:DegT/DnrJ/EryC1/StrS family aminotransferase n=1 Tax=Prosthecobacter sp. TaxID=1965333 RepID=UPI0026035F3D|nr:DegT/DnrJ/EryC1/StrS family aminotransferase [Prosthecobacter sp.]MCF7789783.1 DegT/DnrJ/EryC1/StrS family aminotransferase [Prosthecobacter sp.]
MPSTTNHWSLLYPQADQQRHAVALTQAMQRVCASGSYILGAEVEAFESEFASYLGNNQVVGVASGTDAIELILRALGIGAGSKVAVPSFAPSAVAAGVARSGAEPEFADIEPGTFTLCPEALDALLCSPRGRGVKAAVVVHLYGHPADWESLQRVADEHGIVLLEDCAQAHGALWHGRPVGTLGRAAAFSFYPTKNLAALGDAGAVATNDAALAERVREIRQYGWKQRYVSDRAGVNSRLDELQAAVLRVKLGALNESVLQRRRLAAKYDARLVGNRMVTAPMVRGGCEHAYHQYVVRTKRRDALMQHLQGAGIPVAVHYPVPLHRQQAFGGNNEILLESDRASVAVLSLPMHPYLSEEAVDAVFESLNLFDHEGS